MAEGVYAVTGIRIAPNLTLPLSIVTESVAILAKRRVGKSYTARKIVEGVARAKYQNIITDPKGDWWGLRAGADGDPKGGLPILILGGEHGDLPLEVGAGELIARMVVEDRVSCVLDLSTFRKHEIPTFMTPFLETLYRLKAKEQYRTPVLLTVDEADAIAPQKPADNEARMLGAIEDIVRRGGQRGLGSMLVTQRAAVLNKNVLTQAEILILLRTIAPQDRKAVKAWYEVKGTVEQIAAIEESLPSLPKGDAWVWAPGWPDEDGIFKRVHVEQTTTFDSSATPDTVGAPHTFPKALHDIDLDALEKRMAATVERVKADDPKALKARIRALEAAIAKHAIPSAAPAPPPAAVVKRVEVPALTAKDRAAIERLAKAGEAMAGMGTQKAWLAEVGAVATALQRALAAPTPAPVPAPPLPRPQPAPPAVAARTAPRTTVDGPPTAPGALTAPQQQALDAAATLETLQVDIVDRVTVAAFVGVHPRGGSFGVVLQRLREAGLIEYERGRIVVTEAGHQAATPVDPAAAIERTMRGLSKSQQRIFEIVRAAYPQALTREGIAGELGLHPRGGSFGWDLTRMRQRGLIEYARGQVRLRDFLVHAA